MASVKLHELCRIAPPPSSFSLTFFDMLWLRFHPIEYLFFFPVPHLHPSSFFDTVVPKLKRSLSLTLQHFLPLAGNIVWPSDNSLKPTIQYTSGDSVSLTIAVSDSNFNHVLDYSPRNASQSRAFVPNLDSSDSSASVLSLQITLFPNNGFCIGISSHHAGVDGKSLIMFVKAWAYLCQTEEAESESCGSLPQELEPFLDREVILDPRCIASLYIDLWSGLDPTQKNKPTQKKKPSLEILSDIFGPKVEDSARATFELTRGDFDKIKERVLQKWEKHDTKEEKEDSTLSSKPSTLSTFVLTTAYVSVCIAKAISKAEQKAYKLLLGFQADCRTRLEPPISENYFGNCVMSQMIEAEPEELTDEDGVVIVAIKIHTKIKKIQKGEGVHDEAEMLISKLVSAKNDVMTIGVGVAGSHRFGVYQADFGWGRPKKVEMPSVDRGIAMSLAESKNGDGGVEVGFVLKNEVMDQFALLFRTELESI